MSINDIKHMISKDEPRPVVASKWRGAAEARKETSPKIIKKETEIMSGCHVASDWMKGDAGYEAGNGNCDE